MKSIKKGTVFLITLTDGRYAYGQYLDKSKMGPLVRIFDVITENEIDPAELQGASLMFPPVITGLFAAIKSGLWKVTGSFPVKDFEFPNFISARHDSKAKRVGIWYLWNGKDFLPLGNALPKQYKNLEQLIVWEPHNLMRRIEEGENPYSFLLER